MGLEFGFDNLENGKKIFVKYNKKNYNKIIKKLRKLSSINLDIKYKYLTHLQFF